MWKSFFLIIAAWIILAIANPVIKTNDDELMDNEIHRGDTADPDQWPWMVWIKDTCGGVLLAKRWVLTTAACVSVVQDYEIVLGEFDRNVTSGSEQTITVPSSNIFKHPDFHSILYYNDIALLKLPEAANTADSAIRTIKALSDSATDKTVTGDETRRCYVMGWGLTQESGYWVQANQLQELGVRIIDNEKCEKFIPPIYITPNRVCFKTSGGVCKKDKGGPVVCRVNNKWTLIGLYSVGGPLDGCRGGGRVATRISQYTDWIAETKNSN